MSQPRPVSSVGKCSVLAIGACFAVCVDLRAQDHPEPASFRSAFEAQFPKAETSAAALEIERLATELGIQMAPFESPEPTADERNPAEKNVPVPFVLKPRKERPGPSPELERAVMPAYAAVSEFLNRELGIPDDRIGAPSPQLERFLTDNESGIAAIESLLLREPEIHWEIDVTNYPNGPLPSLTGLMRLQRLLAARALVRARGGETDTALRTLDAGWRLNEVLSSRPELISQLIVVAAAKIHVGILRKLDSPAYGWADRLRSRSFFSAYLTAFQSEVWADRDVQDLTGEAGTYGRILRQVAEGLSSRDICSWTRESLQETWGRAVRDQTRDEAPFSMTMPHLLESIDRWRRFLVDAELTALVLDARAERAASRRRAWPGRLNGIGAGICPRALWTYRADEDGTATFAFEGRIAETAAPVKLPLRFTAGSPDAPVPRTEPLDLYVEEVMRRTGVPGAAVMIVQNGRTIYAKGFGVRELKKQDPVTPDTLMMIGSTGKSMTTMMMATLVDEGKVAWETPANAIYPDFAVSDPALTPRITLSKTVCNCTGIARHDLEMYFASRASTAEEVVRSLRTFPFAGEFGKTFGYVNQMVGAGGYIAAWAARGSSTDLYANYLAQMQARVFGPIGMTSTTFSFGRALANTNRATPHGQTVAGEYLPISPDVDRPLVPYAPAGASWSTARDVSRYLITQLNRGIAPEGKRVVSSENLTATWQPQVDLAPNVSYGLGWLITRYKSRTLLTHGGGTSGFTADLSFLPDVGLGVAILANAQNASFFSGAVRSRAMQFALGEPQEMDANLAKRMEEGERRFREKAARVRPVDSRTTAPYLTSYANRSLGGVTLKLAGRKLIFAAGGFSSELRRLADGEGTYVLTDPPLAGALIRISRSEDGRRSFVLDADDPDITEKYSFSEVR
jgi:CubicO group peptidase (beta-lactamase class C family)